MLKIVLTSAILILTTNVFSQSKSDIYGKWQVYKGYAKKWSLTKMNEKLLQEYRWGTFFHFKEDGTYDEYASAPCGLDDNHYSYSGKWSYNEATKTIELSNIQVNNGRPNIYSKYKVLSSGSFKINSHKKGKFETLEIEVTKAWEKNFVKKR